MSRARPDIVTHQTRGGVVTAAINRSTVGQIEAVEIAEQLVPLIGEAGSLRGFVLDLREVEYVNSSGLGLIIDLGNRAKERGATAVAFGLRAEIKALFELMKIGRFYQFAPDADAAMKIARG
ncbi:MAG: STAS domain-containing protein [Phycisphaerales bacterium]|nr:STAS domain-containing protein [Phycisphaerae bacterium]NNF45007.1 STAS domain-containing protein [Phycisphaerales bacterium]NNM26046.1 STAS domain-containing protein [Phycisphaerales bacterium]